MIKWLTILVACLGLAVALYAVATEGQDKAIPPAPAAPPSVNPFARGIAAAGTIEAASRNIAIAAPEGGLVAEVFSPVGGSVKKNDPLFRLDTRLLDAELVRARSTEAASAARLARLKAQPRAEDVPPLEAALARANALLADAESQLADTQRAATSQAVSASEITRRTFAVDVARAEVRRNEATLQLMRAGAWAPDIAVAEADLAQTKSEVEAIKLRIDRFTVRSPIDATVLKRNIEPGQFVPTSAPALVIGDLSTLRVRARVDEEDAPLLKDRAKGVARVRGVASESLELRWLWVEPLAEPKTELTGATIERVDTRVVEVMFEVVGTPRARLFAGQVVDVFIDAEGAGTAKN